MICIYDARYLKCKWKVASDILALSKLRAIAIVSVANSLISFAQGNWMCLALKSSPLSFTQAIRKLITWCERGVWGEGSEAAGSPHSCSAKLIYGKSAPEGRWNHMKAQGFPRKPWVWMMVLPLGFRVSGCFQRKHPIKKIILGDNFRARIACDNMRRGYVVTPPNCARIRGWARNTKVRTRIRAPDS